jgi:fluoroacetyl-CoA thioesterase
VASVTLTIGVCGQAELVVSERDTAISLATGDVAVLATPRLVQLCEQAAVAALQSHLKPGQTSVAFRIEFSHVAPIAVGSRVIATATLERTEGRRLIFNTSVNDVCGLVAAGRVTRVLVDTESFMEKAR